MKRCNRLQTALEFPHTSFTAVERDMGIDPEVELAIRSVLVLVLIESNAMVGSASPRVILGRPYEEQ